MQDVIAIAVAAVAAAWIARTVWRRMKRPACGKAGHPAGADGFVPLGDVVPRTGKNSGRP